MECNKPKKTPGHATKSHVVKACEGGEEKIIRFGQQGVEGAGKNPTTAKDKARKKSYTHGIMPRIPTLTKCRQDIGVTKRNGKWRQVVK